MLIFIPTTDYNRDATEAETISDFDLGSIRIGTRAAFSFRIGNIGSNAVTWSLYVRDEFDPDYPDKWELPTGGQLAAGETTDTLTALVNVPINATEIGTVVDLVATDGTEETTLQVVYEAMGTNSWRRSNYPRRAGDASDTAANVIDSLGDILRILVFDPVPHVETGGYGVKMKAEALSDARDNLAGYRSLRIVNGTDPCDRLNPKDETYGYAQSLAIIQGQFSRESRETRQTMTATDTTLVYDVGASLAFRAEDELIRHWASFTPATETEPEQFKRSVFILQRLGELWAIENIRVIDKGDVLSHFEADCIALHSRMMGKPTFYNPFAITYPFESDVPYAQFTCLLDFPVEYFEGIPSGSGVFSDSS